MNKSTVVNQAARSLKWSALGSILPRLVTPLTTAVLAALLSEADFGIIAAAMAVIALAQIVVEMGLGAAVIQREQQAEEVASLALWLSLLVGLMLYAVLWLAAPALAAFYTIPELTAVLRVVGLGLPLAALISIPNALLTRDMAFRQLFWIGAMPQIATALGSLLLALLGLGYWALVGGYLLGRVLHVALVWRANHWRPRWLWQTSLVGQLLRFSAWVLLSGFQTWLFLYADNLLVGYFYNTEQLGIYSLGFNLANILPGMLASSLAYVAYPAFSRLQADRRAVGDSLMKLQALAGALLFPVCLGMAALAEPAITLLYGQKWAGLGWTLGFFAVMPGLSNIWSLNAEAYRAVGRPDVWAKVAGLTLLLMFPLLLLGGRLEYNRFVMLRFAAAFLLPLFNIWAAARLLHIPLAAQWRSWRVPLIWALLMFAAVVALRTLLAPFDGWAGWGKLSLLAVCGAGIYSIGMRLTDRALFNQFLLSVKRMGLAPQSE